MPKFCKRYSEVGEMISNALSEFNRDVKSHSFPGKDYSPYPIKQAELDKLCTALKEEGMHEAADAAFREYEKHRKKDMT